MCTSNRKRKIKKGRNNLKKKKSKIKKILIIVAIFIMNALGFINAVYATPYIDTAYIYSVSNCGELLKYKGGVVETDYVQYSYNGVDYPAYCMDKTKERSSDRILYSYHTRNHKRRRIMESYYKWVSI